MNLLLQAKADASRQAAEEAAGENQQLGAHVHLLEAELEAAHARASAKHGGPPHPGGGESAEVSPREEAHPPAAQAAPDQASNAAAPAEAAPRVASPPDQATPRPAAPAKQPAALRGTSSPPRCVRAALDRQWRSSDRPSVLVVQSLQDPSPSPSPRLSLRESPVPDRNGRPGNYLGLTAVSGDVHRCRTQRCNSSVYCPTGLAGPLSERGVPEEGTRPVAQAPRRRAPRGTSSSAA